MVISLLSGLLVGAVLGITGAGGGIFAIPILVMSMGWAPQQAAPVALITVAGSAALGAIDASRKGLIRYRAAIAITLAGMPMTSVGLWVAQRSSSVLLSLLFAGVMLTVAWRLMRMPEMTATHAYPVTLNEHTGRFVWTLNTWLLFLSFGTVTGFMTGCGCGRRIHYRPVTAAINAPAYSQLYRDLTDDCRIGRYGRDCYCGDAGYYSAHAFYPLVCT